MYGHINILTALLLILLPLPRMAREPSSSWPASRGKLLRRRRHGGGGGELSSVTSKKPLKILTIKDINKA